MKLINIIVTLFVIFLMKFKMNSCFNELIYCIESKIYLDSLCNENIHGFLDKCPQGTIYCPLSDECLYYCDDNFIKPQIKNNKMDKLEEDEHEVESMEKKITPLLAVFTNTLNSIRVLFDYKLVPQLIVPCEDIFSTETLNLLGKDPNCEVIDSEILITLGYESTILPLNSLEFISNNSIKAIQNKLDYNEINVTEDVFNIEGNILIDNAQNPSPPYLLIYGPTQICTRNFSLKLINFSGHSNKLKLFWQVISEPESYDDNSKIESILTNSRNNDEINLNSTMFQLNTIYTIKVRAENRFGIRSSTDYIHSLVHVNKSFTVNIHGNQYIDPSAENIFTASIIDCSSSNWISETDEHLYIFKWSIEPSDVALSDLSTTRLVIPDHKLYGGVSYILIVEAINKLTKMSDRHSLVLNTILDNLKPIVNTNRLIKGTTGEYVFDAKLSYDPSNTKDKLKFLWNCKSHNSSSSCENIISTNNYLYFPSQLLSPGKYLFNMTISKKNRKSWIEIPVIIMNGSLPTIYIDYNYNNKYKLNIDEEIIINAYITSDYDVNVKWENIKSKYSEINLDSLQPIIGNREWNLVKPNHRRVSLIFPPANKYVEGWNGLRGENEYRFSLQASSLDGKRIALCDILISTNEPPKGGSIKIIPDKGIAMKTLFKIDFGTNWVDMYNDCPLSYEIFYSYPNECTPTMITSIYSSEPSFVTVLPGSCHKTTELMIASRVCDKYKSCTVTTSIISILARNLSLDDIHYFSNQTWKFLNKGFIIEAIFQARSMLQTFYACDLEDQSLIHQISSIFQDIIEQISERLIQEYELNIKTQETTRQFVNLIYSAGTSLSPKLMRSSTINQLIKLRLVCIQSLTSQEMFKNSRQKSYFRRFKRTFHSLKILPFIPLNIHEVYTFLLLDELIFKYESSFKKANQILDNINYYLSDLCLELRTFSNDADISTDLFQLRTERIIIDENDKNFLPIASKSREEIGGYIQLSKHLFDHLKKWRCNIGISCPELCLVSAEINTKIAVKLNSSFQGPLVQIDFVNPQNGEKLTVKNLKEPVIFPLPLETKPNIMTGSLRCALYDHLHQSISIKDCQTLFSSTSYLLCSCQSLGYHGAVNKNDVNNITSSSEKRNSKSNMITTENAITMLTLNVTSFNYDASKNFTRTRLNVSKSENATYSPFFQYSTQPFTYSIYTDDFNRKYTAPNLNKNFDNINNFTMSTTQNITYFPSELLTNSLLTKYFNYNKTFKSPFDSDPLFEKDSVTTSPLYFSLPSLSTIFDEKSTSLIEDASTITKSLLNFLTIKYGNENSIFPVNSITEVYSANSTDKSISISSFTTKMLYTNNTINSVNKKLTKITNTSYKQSFSQDFPIKSTTALNKDTSYDRDILNNSDTLSPEKFPITDNDYHISTLSMTSFHNTNKYKENSNVQNKFLNDKAVIILKIILDGNFDEYTASLDERTAINYTIDHLAYVLQVSKDSFLNIKLENGSIIINCVIDKEMIDNIDDMKNKLNKLKYLNGVNGDIFLVKNYIIKGESTSIKNDNGVTTKNHKSTNLTNSTQKLTTRSLKNENENTITFSETSTLSLSGFSTLPSKEIDESFMMKISFIAEEDYNSEFIGKEKEFIDNLVKELSEQLNLPMESFQNVQVLNGMKIELEIHSGPNATVQMVKDGHAYYTNLINNGNAFIRGIDGNLIKLYDSSTNLRTTFSTESSKVDSTASTLFNSNEKKESYSLIYIYIGSALVVIVTLIILILSYKVHIKKKYGKVLPTGLRRISSKDSSKSDSRVELISPLGGTSLRKYSYDSGVWINGVNEQIKNFAPKPAVYSPPDEKQIMTTPRPPTIVIRKDYKMRHDYISK